MVFMLQAQNTVVKKNQIQEKHKSKGFFFHCFCPILERVDFYSALYFCHQLTSFHHKLFVSFLTTVGRNKKLRLLHSAVAFCLNALKNNNASKHILQSALQKWKVSVILMILLLFLLFLFGIKVC